MAQLQFCNLARSLTLAVELQTPTSEHHAAVLAARIAEGGGVPPDDLGSLTGLDGFDAVDLASLADRALVMAATRGLPGVPGTASGPGDGAEGLKGGLRVSMRDVESARAGMVAGAHLGTRAAGGGEGTPGLSWDDVGGLDEGKQASTVWGPGCSCVLHRPCCAGHAEHLRQRWHASRACMCG